MGSEVAYNLYRWYLPAAGRYARVDPLRDPKIFQLYGYVEQNPLYLSDADGLVPSPYSIPGFFKVGCVYGAVRRAGLGLVGSEGPRWAHCMASCEIAKCGGTSLARDLGLLKEKFDTSVCLGLTVTSRIGLGGRGIIRDRHCESAFQPEDFEDNEFGISCPADVTCDERCEQLRGEPNSAPGPLGGLVEGR